MSLGIVNGIGICEPLHYHVRFRSSDRSVSPASAGAALAFYRGDIVVSVIASQIELFREICRAFHIVRGEIKCDFVSVAVNVILVDEAGL